MMHSGGARGSDKVFEELASSMNQITCHHVINPFKKDAPLVKNIYYEFEKTELEKELNQILKTVNITLQRVFPTKNHVVNGLLQRNVMIILSALKESSQNIPPLFSCIKNPKFNSSIDGGTAWGIQTYIQILMDKYGEKNNEGYCLTTQLPIYILDTSLVWRKHVISIQNNRKIIKSCWKIIDNVPNPSQFETWIGIGTREISEAQTDEILKLAKDKDNGKKET